MQFISVCTVPTNICIYSIFISFEFMYVSCMYSCHICMYVYTYMYTYVMNQHVHGPYHYLRVSIYIPFVFMYIFPPYKHIHQYVYTYIYTYAVTQRMHGPNNYLRKFHILSFSIPGLS